VEELHKHGRRGFASFSPKFSQVLGQITQAKKTENLSDFHEISQKI